MKLKRIVSLLLCAVLLLGMAPVIPVSAAAEGGVTRLGGKTRFDTSFVVAEEMKRSMGVDAFDAVIIASGTNFADALSGSYLAAVKSAPILLCCNADFNPKYVDYYNDMVIDYVEENLISSGTVYILGGTKAVPASMDEALASYQVVRLSGKTRYETNLRILEEAGVAGKDILICNGEGFPDSLSASATKLPILLVNSIRGLTDEQISFLKSCRGDFCIVGGMSAVSSAVEEEIQKYGTTTRLKGKDRFETSVLLAEKYFDNPDMAVLAYAWNFPDGLCGGALASVHNAPLILTSEGKEVSAQEYAHSRSIYGGYILGSAELISDKMVEKIFPDSGEEKDPAVFCPSGEKHDFLMETVSAGCTQGGYTSGTCQECGYTYLCDLVNALGHQWGEPVTVKAVSCTEDGLQTKTCSRCTATQEEPIQHSGHNYQLSAAEGDAETGTVTYVCTGCSDKITQNWDAPQPQEQKDQVYLPDRSAGFTFLVSCQQGEAYLRENLSVTGEAGEVSYTVTAEGDGTYRIAAAEPYQQYQTYYVSLADDMTLPEYNARGLEFSIVGSDRAEVEFNEDNLIFLKTLELEAYGTSGEYELQWDEAAQRYYLTLFKLESLDPSMIGKILGIGDYTSTEEILEDSSRELSFAKLEKISHNEKGELLLELSVPQLSEVYDKLDIYFAGGNEDIQMEGDPEAAFVNAVTNSEGFTEYVTAVHLAAESYASDHGLVVAPLSESAKDNLKFELTKHDLKPTADATTCKLELGGKITYTIPLKTKAGHASGSITMSCYAEITATISAGGSFEDEKSIDLHLTNTTTTTLGFKLQFNLEYSQEYETTYLVHKTTHKIHTSTCRIAKNETSSANLQKLTAQELSEMYNGDKDAMQKDECKVCLAVTGLDGSAYVYNANTGVLHCMNCVHVSSIKNCNLYTLYPENTIGFELCKDCEPEKRQTQDFDKRMLNAIKGSDWEEQVQDFQEMMGDSLGSQKPAADKDPVLSVPINIAGVFNIEIGVEPVFEFNMEASVDFTITASTTNTYGIRSTGETFETYSHETPGKVDYKLSFTGEADAKFGIELTIKAYPVGCEKVACIAISGQVGLYGHFTGIFVVEGTLGEDPDVYCAARLEAGLYVRMDGYWNILWFDDDFEILKEQRIPLFKWGYDRMYYAFEQDEIELKADPDDFVMFDLSKMTKAKYLDLTSMKYETGLVSLAGKSHLTASVNIENEDGTPCDFLVYLSENGMIYKKDSAPEEFSVVITIQVTPKVQINSLKEFFNSQTKNTVYGYSLDPLVIRLKVEEVMTSGTCGENLTWSLTEDGELTISGTGAMYDYGYVAQPWRDYRDTITSVVIENGVTTIGEYAFNKCISLSEITIPGSVTAIGDYAFAHCTSLSGTIIQDGVTTIGGYAFWDCTSLREITIPGSVTSIGSSAFYECTSLSEITIQDGVTAIGSSAFSNCTSLVEITIPGSVTTIGRSAFYDCESLGKITIQEGVTDIGDSAFSYCTSLREVTIPDGVATIGEYAFNECISLSEITIPGSVTTIEEHAFEDCESLSELTIQEGVTAIGGGAFTRCTSLREITIPGSVNTIGKSAFYGCTSLAKITIQDGVTTIGSSAFAYCTSLSEVAIPGSVTGIGSSAFSHCTSLSELTIQKGVTTIGEYAFNECTSLGEVTIPGSVTTIGASAFDDCESLSELTIQEGVTAIGGGAFTRCTSLCEVTIPGSVNTIGKSAFYGCTSLAEITIQDGVTTVGSSAFYACTSLTGIAIPGSVTSIGSSAFSNCTSLTRITFVGNAPKFGDYVFSKVNATAYYPAGNPTWTAAVMKDYGGTINWVS